MPELRNPSGVAASPAYSHLAIAAPSDTLLLLTGQVAYALDGSVVPGGINAQLEQVWNNIVEVLATADADLSHVLRLTTYTTDARYKDSIATAKAGRFSPSAMPASTFLVVTALAEPELLVEIDVIAAVPTNRGEAKQ